MSRCLVSMLANGLAVGLALAACKSAESAGPPPRDAMRSDAPLAHPDGRRDGPIRWIDGFSTPESVLWDEQADVYLVSNINGGALDEDDNGFIARVAPPPDARVLDLSWIDGADPEVVLNAPKGMALVGDTLYVADIDAVRMFDRASGAPRGVIALPGTIFVNDLVAGADGAVYASETGVDGRLVPTPSQSVWELRPGAAPRRIAEGVDLGGPNGLVMVGGELWVVGFVSGELYRLNGDGQVAPERLPRGTLDGVVALPDGRLVITSWEAAGAYVGRPGGPWKQVIANMPSPADLGLDGKRGLLLIPSFAENRVELHPVPGP